MKKSKNLSGDPEATLRKAHEMLTAAKSEAKSKAPFACRQAAQKVWLAATTAADTVAGPRDSGKKVIEAFQKAWGASGMNVAQDIENALHVAVHYSNGRCSPDNINEHVKKLRKVISSPVRDAQMRARLKRIR